MQPFQMKDGAVRVIRPSAWRKPAVCVLCRWGCAQACRRYWTGRGVGAGGQRKTEPECAWTPAPQNPAPCIPRTPAALCSDPGPLHSRSWPPAPPACQQPQGMLRSSRLRPRAPGPPESQRMGSVTGSLPWGLRATRPFTYGSRPVELT